MSDAGKVVAGGAREPGSVIDERYVLGEPIGRGGDSWVHVASDRETGDTVAIKFVRSDSQHGNGHARFRRTTELLLDQRHPALVQVLGSGHDTSVGSYLVMERVAGETLQSVVQREGALAPKDAIAIAKDILDGLDLCHRCGLIHRDVSAANIIIPFAPRAASAVLIDFGLALSERQPGSRVTSPDQVVGTLPYIAPERLLGETVGDTWSDVYSMGVVLYFMLGGALPFEALDPGALVDAILLKAPPSLLGTHEDISEELDRIVLRALSRLPHDRFASARRFRLALGRAATNSEHPDFDELEDTDPNIR